MKRNTKTGLIFAGISAGAVAGLFGAGGGMLLVPLLPALTDTPEDAIFPTSLSIMLPICLISLVAAEEAADGCCREEEKQVD